MSILSYFAIIAFLIVLIGVINEKWLHIQGDIVLILFSLGISLLILILQQIPGVAPYTSEIRLQSKFNFAAYLLDGVLCFMLFAGASRVSVTKFSQNIRPISLLALLGTVVSSAVYGLLFYLAASVLHMDMSLWTCILLGCIVSPTDPIAATGILNKLGMSKNVTSVIECESLFNDGTGVALFLFVKGILSQKSGGNFFYIMGKELFGAIAVAIIVSFLLFSLLRLTKDPVKHILISLTDVMLVYVICEHLGFSGVIASVVCGMCFAYMRNRIARRLVVQDPEELYDDFWEVVDGILNAVLFMLLGLSVMNAQASCFLPVLFPVGIAAVILSRYAGVRSCTFFMERGRIPGNYSSREFSMLMTWSALKGGLSLALALGTAEFLSQEVYLIVLNTTYITIFFTVLVQGLTTKRIYRLIEEKKNRRIKEERNR
ncbi:MAG: sodium:proton antiporter [Lachnospiraceae bacterium]|nr:sodium:proton antiporter [Lachnospiraceae bacterium]